MAAVLAATGAPGAQVERQGGRVFLVDQRGERWEVTEAERRGFRPEGFQYGIGRDAFVPLTDDGLREPVPPPPPGLRVIGVGRGREARAYSVPLLRGHEVANAWVGEDPVAVAY
ncbi:MAG: DUF3179 domain-containing protein [Candidatus Dadabacteria bacterium]|nr:MAG: DUF3179 domain-containing protein [Candidatus Dadabacteria bacterium]